MIAMADEKWGEVPAAFVETRDGESPSEDELIAHCKAHLAKYKAPKKIIFEPLARTSTGKIQKFVMRKRLQEILDGG